MSKRAAKLWTVSVALGLLSFSACGSDAKKKANCGDAAVCSAAGVSGGALTDGGIAGTSGGGGAGTGSGAGATGSGTAGTNAADGGGSAAGSGGGAGTGSVAPNKPKADGTELASCEPGNAMSCNTGLACYTASGATTVGFCTKTCKVDGDCTSLGANFACSSPTGGQNPMQYCRVSCTGTMDTMCPDKMSCLAVQGGFRCLYDAKDIGSGTATAWQMCTGSGDCTGDLICNPARPTTVGAATYSGACTSKCMMDMDCKDKPATGTATQTCANGSCQLGCTAPVGGPGGGATDAGSECPDTMQCVPQGRGGRGRCLYVDTSGGV